MKYGALFFLPLLCACVPQKPNNCIVTSVAPIAHLTRQIAGDHFRVSYIVSAASNFQQFTTNETDTQIIQDAKIILAIDGISDSFLLRRKDKNTFLLSPKEGKQMMYPWLSFQQSKIFARRIAQILIELKPEAKKEFQSNAQVFITQMDQLQQELRVLLKGKDISVFQQYPVWNVLLKELRIRNMGHLYQWGDTEVSVDKINQMVTLLNKQGNLVFIDHTGTQPLSLFRRIHKQTTSRYLVQNPLLAVGSGDDIPSLLRSMAWALVDTNSP